MSAQWLYRVFDQEFGPVSIEELRQLAVNGIVASDSEVRSTESVDWVVAGTIKELGLQGVAGTPASPAVSRSGSDPDLNVAKGVDDWFYLVGELEFGPVTFDELLELARTEQVGADDSIKLGATGKWRRAGSIGRLMAVLPFQAAKSRPAAARPVAAPVPQRDSVVVSADLQKSQPDRHVDYQLAYEQAKENIAGLILSQAEAAFAAAEAQARAEFAWALAPGVDRQWWGWMGGVAFGPVEIEQVFALVRNGQVKPTDFVRNGQFGQFVPASTVPGLFNAVAILAKGEEALALAKTQAKVAAELAVPVVAPPAVAPMRPAAIATQSGETRPNQARGKSDPQVAVIPAANVRRTPATEIPISGGANPARKGESPAEAPTPVQVAVAAAVPAPETDEVILARVRQALDSRNIPGFNRIELSVRAGVVSAQGNLSSDGERLLAVRLLEQSDGVVRVDHQLAVTAPARPAPQKAPTRAAVPSRSGPGVLSEWIESLKGEYRNHAIASLVLVGVLGYLLYPRGPVRPVAVHPVKGKVIMDGQPLANAAIVLHRVGNSKLPANLHPRGKASSDGTFQLETFDPADGAPDGDFVATVFLTEETEVDGEKQAGPNVLPTVYSKPETSPLKLKITSSTKELQPLELKKG